MTLPKCEQKRQRGERFLSPRQQLDVAALASVIGRVLLVSEAQRLIVVVKADLPTFTGRQHCTTFKGGEDGFHQDFVCVTTFFKREVRLVEGVQSHYCYLSQ